jgi:DNA polymerase-3 subunit alpha
MNHSLPYSFVGIQTIYLAINFNPIYWNTACLIVNSGATDEEIGGSTDYGKIAKAIGDTRAAGINVSLANINSSVFGFKPDVKNNRILFGLKGMLNVGDDLVQEIIAKRPYVSVRDFLNKVNPNRQAMIALIKGGAFDELMDRKECMVWYIWDTCDKKNRLTLSNMPTLLKYNLVPDSSEEMIMAKRVYEFNRYLKALCKYGTDLYLLDTRAINFLIEIGKDNLFLADDKNQIIMRQKDWDKCYQLWMNIFRNWISENKDTILRTLNESIFLEDWNKYTKGNSNISSWEMEVLCFYYHEHELANVNRHKYGLSNFFDLPTEPEVEKTFTRGGKTINIYKLNKIYGTCIAKNKTKSTVTLLTPTGVVEVKFRKEYFTLFDKQISERQLDGTKKIKEKSWFNRGNMIVVMGIRDGDTFVSKKYNSTDGH